MDTYIPHPAGEDPVANEHRDGGPARAVRRRRLAVRLAVGIVIVAAFVVGVRWGAGEDFDPARAVSRVLYAIGSPQVEAYRSMASVNAEPGTAEYLLFYQRGASTDERAQVLTAFPEVRRSDDTIFPNAVVITVPEPAKETVSALRGMQAVWLVLKDRPFFFCH